MIQDLCRDAVILRFPAGDPVDGQTAYTECEAQAFVIDYGKRLLKEVGLEQDTRFFVIAASAAVDAGFARSLNGVQVVANGRSCDLKNIKVCRQIDGRIECYSCAAF